MECYFCVSDWSGEADDDERHEIITTGGSRGKVNRNISEVSESCMAVSSQARQQLEEKDQLLKHQEADERFH